MDGARGNKGGERMNNTINTADDWMIYHDLKNSVGAAEKLAAFCERLLFDRDEARKEIDALRAENEQLREAARWIPVTERLPQISGIYQVYRVLNQYAIPFGYMYWDGHNRMWGSSWEGAQITHWRPLPDLPQEGEKGG